MLPIRTIDVRFRCIFRIEKDGAKTFAILLDAKNLIKGKYLWKTIVRYDCAHGFLHKDILDSNGKKVLRKEKLPTQDKLEAIRFIVRQVISDLKRLGTWSHRSRISERQTLVDIRKTEERMIQLFKSPVIFQELESIMVAFSEEKVSIIKIKKEELDRLRKQSLS